MSKIPDDLKYSKSHEWVRVEDGNVIIVGITDHAQAALGDMVFVETPQTGTRLDAEEACSVVESVKSASDIYSPAAGEIVAGNSNLADSPELINDDPYGEGWIFQMRVDDADALGELMNAQAYEAFCEEE